MVYRNPHVFMGVPGLPEYEMGVTDEEKIRAGVRKVGQFAGLQSAGASTVKS